jgi:uncharacterized protein YfbU (UPF0304 family)
MSVVTLRLDQDLKKRLDLFCHDTNQSMSDAVRNLIEEHLLEKEKLGGRSQKVFNDFERLQLYHTLKLRRAIETENTALDGEIEILERGWEGEYHTLYLPREFVPAETTREVREILTMYVELKIGWLASTEKRGMTLEAVEFRGFDHEGQETSYQNFAAYLLEVQGSYSQLRDAEGNMNVKSDHVSHLSEYRIMLPIWKKYREQNFRQDTYQLNIDQVHAIISAPIWKRSVN